MSLAATFGFGQSPVRQPLSGDNKRWAASFALVLALHVVATVFILRWYQNLPAPTPLPPSLTMIELAPLPAPPASPMAAPPPPPPPPEPQVQPQEEPVPVAKPLVQPKPRPVVKHVERSRPKPQPTQTVDSMAPVTAPPTPTPPAQSSVSDHAIPRFTDLIAAQLERYKRYPALAQRRGEQGVALLRFTLNRAGNVLNARIERGSGHPDLDEECWHCCNALSPCRKSRPISQRTRSISKCP